RESRGGLFPRYSDSAAGIAALREPGDLAAGARRLEASAGSLRAGLETTTEFPHSPMESGAGPRETAGAFRGRRGLLEAPREESGMGRRALSRGLCPPSNGRLQRQRRGF